MSRNEDFDNGIWSDPEFEELSRDAAWLYIWSWTNPRCDMAGIYKVGRRAMTESRVDLSNIDAALSELAAVHFAYYEQGVLWVRSRVKRLRSKQDRMAISVARDLAKIPSGHPLRRSWLEVYGDHAWLRLAIANVLKGTSSEVHEIADEHEDQENLTGTSVEVLKDVDVDASSSSKKAPPRATSRVDQTIPPRELPTNIADRVDPVLAILQAVHAERGGSVPTIRGVGLALKSFPRRDHVAVAKEVEHWALAGLGQSRPVKDLVRLYRTFLERSPEADPLSVTSSRTSAAGMRRDPDAERRERTARRLGTLIQPTSDIEGSAVDAA